MTQINFLYAEDLQKQQTKSVSQIIDYGIQKMYKLKIIDSNRFVNHVNLAVLNVKTSVMFAQNAYRSFISGPMCVKIKRKIVFCILVQRFKMLPVKFVPMDIEK